MIFITTSRKPSRRTRSFCKELQRSLPDGLYYTRGKAPMQEILQNKKTIYVTEKKGNPEKMEIYIEGKFSFSIPLKGVTLRKEMKDCPLVSGSELTDKLSGILGIDRGLVKQHEDFIIFKNGPGFKILTTGAKR